MLDALNNLLKFWIGACWFFACGNLSSLNNIFSSAWFDKYRFFCFVCIVFFVNHDVAKSRNRLNDV